MHNKYGIRGLTNTPGEAVSAPNRPTEPSAAGTTTGWYSLSRSTNSQWAGQTLNAFSSCPIALGGGYVMLC